MMELDSRGKKMITSGIIVALLFASLDQTIVSTAMPTIVQQLGGMSLYSWVFTAYMLTETVSIMIFGKLADLFGRRNVFLIGIGLFFAGSILCGFSQSIEQLILFRAIQGIGAGAIMPLSMTLISDIYPPEERGKMQGMMGAVFGVTSVIGPAVGGLITDFIGWHWVFFVNIPFCLFSFWAISKALKNQKQVQRPAIDWWGSGMFLLFTIPLLLSTVFAGSGDGGYNWGSPTVIAMFVLSFMGLLLFIWIEARVKEPILPLSLFRIRPFSVASAVSFLMGAGMFGAITYIPVFMQNIVGVSASLSGYVLTPMMFAMILTSILTGRAARKVPFRNLTLIGLGIMCIGFALMAQISSDASSWEVVSYMVLIGLGLGFIMPVVTLVSQESVSPEQKGIATSASNFFRSIGGTLGVSIMGTIMTQQMVSGISKVIQEQPEAVEWAEEITDISILKNPEFAATASPNLISSLVEAFTSSIHYVFWLAAGLIFVGLLVTPLMGKYRLISNKKEDHRGV